MVAVVEVLAELHFYIREGVGSINMVVQEVAKEGVCNETWLQKVTRNTSTIKRGAGLTNIKCAGLTNIMCAKNKHV